MFIVLLFLSLLIPISPISNKQTNKEDFSQYSYQISIEIRGEKKTANGTGFFLFYDSSFYFITAEHCLTGCKQNTRPILSDTASIFGIDSNGAIYTIVSVDISNVKKELLSCPPHWDIIALKISGKILDKTKIHSVEKFIKPPFETTSDAMFIGFPGYVNKTSTFVFAPSTTLFFDSSNIECFQDSSRLYYTISYNKSINQDSIDGYSGSPVFLKNSSKNEWRILGALSQDYFKSDGHQVFVIPKIDSLIKDIDQKSYSVIHF